MKPGTSSAEPGVASLDSSSSEPSPKSRRPGVTLVTGAGGFIGRHLVLHLRSMDVDVLGVEHSWKSGSHLDQLLGREPVEACIHLGWYADPSDYLSNELANLRSLGSSVQLLTALVRRGCRYLAVAGTSAEYRPSSIPLTEDGDLEGATSYARAKGTVRELAMELSSKSLMETAWCRIFNVAGPGEHPRRLLPLVTHALLTASPVDLTVCTQVRDFLDVRDVAGALAAISTSRVVGPINVCSGEAVSLRELLSSLTTRCGSLDLLRFGARPRRQGDPDFVVGDKTKLAEETGWKPSISRDQMLDDVVQYWSSRLQQR